MSEVIGWTSVFVCSLYATITALHYIDKTYEAGTLLNQLWTLTVILVAVGLGGYAVAMALVELKG